jgi:hypothetical protein
VHPAKSVRRASLVAAMALACASAPLTALADPRFEYEVERVRRSDLPHSWRPGCPVGPKRLRLVTVSHRGFDGEVKTGRLVVARNKAGPIVRVMRRLFRAGYPIKRMRLVDEYGGSDRRSMNANNTSAFNCRAATGSTSWSEHAYGRAIDVNPVQNPYVSPSGRVLPKRGRPFVDRSRDHPAMIHAGDRVVRAFARIGWSWGGSWSSTKDYQHFSQTGR